MTKINFKALFKIVVVLQMVLLAVGCASTGSSKEKSQLAMPYTRLKVLDLDEMSDMLYEKANAYKKTEDPKVIQEGLLICLSRPNEDGLIEKVISIVRTPMEDNDIWESSVEQLVNTAIETMKNSQGNATDQVTYNYVLENLISEFKPQFIKQYKNPGFETKIIERIADADIELTRQAVNEKRMNLMRGNVSPSAIAKKLIEKRNEILKK